MAKGIVKGGLNDSGVGSGGDTSDATADEGSVAYGKTAYVNVGKITGKLIPMWAMVKPSYNSRLNLSVSYPSATTPLGSYAVSQMYATNSVTLLRVTNVIQRNGTYRFSVFGRTTAAGVTCKVGMDICDKPDPSGPEYTLTNDWQKISVEAVVDNWTSGTYHFIDMQVREQSKTIQLAHFMVEEIV